MRSLAWNGDHPVTQLFGVNPQIYAVFGLRGHNGIDIGCPIGTPLFAVEPGLVTEAHLDGTGYGETIYITADSGRGWRYGHLSRRDVVLGQRVGRGTPVGPSGTTGFSTGPHLHLGLRPPNPDRLNGFSGYIDPVITLVALEESPEDMARIQELEAALAAATTQLSAITQDRDLQNKIKFEFEAFLRGTPLFTRRGRRYKPVGNVADELIAKVLSG